MLQTLRYVCSRTFCKISRKPRIALVVNVNDPVNKNKVANGGILFRTIRVVVQFSP